MRHGLRGELGLVLSAPRASGYSWLVEGLVLVDLGLRVVVGLLGDWGACVMLSLDGLLKT